MRIERVRMVLRITGTVLPLILAGTAFAFALLSGADQEGEGLAANLPNALPWALLAIMTLLARRREATGGAVLILTGLAAAWFFDLLSPPSWPGLAALTLPLVLSGACFLVSWGLREKSREEGTLL